MTERDWRSFSNIWDRFGQKGRRLESIGCSDGVEIESRDDEERKRRDRGG